MTDYEKNIEEVKTLLKAGTITSEYYAEMIAHINKEHGIIEDTGAESSAVSTDKPPIEDAPPSAYGASSVRIRVAVGGKEVGEFERDDVIKKIQSGEIKKDARFWQSGMTDWVKAGELPAFEKYFPEEEPLIEGKLTGVDEELGDYEYEGDIVNGLRHGKGKIEWEDGDVYEGDWVDDKRHGKGKLTSSDGRVIYKGDWVDDKKHGKGKYTWANGDVYEGDWKDNNRTGKGKKINKDGSVYEGDWVNGNRAGKGKKINKDGSVYEGDFKDDNFNGKGKMINNNGSVYEGDFKDDNFNGKGKFTDKFGVYEGDWVDNKKHGKGKLTSADGRVLYEGYWDNGQPKQEKQNTSSIVKETYPNGDIYEGEMLNGKRHGKGKYTWVDGNVYKGDWVDDKTNNMGKLTYNGDVLEGEDCQFCIEIESITEPIADLITITEDGATYQSAEERKKTMSIFPLFYYSSLSKIL